MRKGLLAPFHKWAHADEFVQSPNAEHTVCGGHVTKVT